MNSLITAAATAVAYKVEKHLAGVDKVVLADESDLPQVLLKGRNFIKIPPGSSNSFAHQLLSVCLDLEIKKVYPLKRAEILALAEARLLFDEYGIVLMIPDLAKVSALLGNLKTGEMIVNEDDGAYAGRGIYLFDPANPSQFQLLTAD